MYVKICGLRTDAAASHAARLGSDAVGVVMSEGSPRNASPDEALSVIAAARNINPNIDTVLVVRYLPATEAAQLALELGFDVLQLHGAYTKSDFAAAATIHPRIWRATSLAEHPSLYPGEYREERLLIDGASPGSGEPWDLELIQRADLGDAWLLAGGLTPETVIQAITDARPAGVDVSSGVESAPGVKSLDLIAQFVQAARSV